MMLSLVFRLSLPLDLAGRDAHIPLEKKVDSVSFLSLMEQLRIL